MYWEADVLLEKYHEPVTGLGCFCDTAQHQHYEPTDSIYTASI